MSNTQENTTVGSSQQDFNEKELLELMGKRDITGILRAIAFVRHMEKIEIKPPTMMSAERFAMGLQFRLYSDEQCETQYDCSVYYGEEEEYPGEEEYEVDEPIPEEYEVDDIREEYEQYVLPQESSLPTYEQYRQELIDGMFDDAQPEENTYKNAYDVPDELIEEGVYFDGDYSASIVGKLMYKEVSRSGRIVYSNGSYNYIRYLDMLFQLGKGMMNIRYVFTYSPKPLTAGKLWSGWSNCKALPDGDVCCLC